MSGQLKVSAALSQENSPPVLFTLWGGGAVWASEIVFTPWRREICVPLQGTELLAHILVNIHAGCPGCG
jgi:hypothetical protein